ncbi:uncharacterized protein LOC116170128 [Photinus pyralis]|uniref:Uncharacterized protein n=1 Tax=Photinus pyralis TaxID=7054 RepID=A0A1Y1MAZ0_PHOPY|nr:uncharacterized protein LOC116170128 [Photinus pyralis]
MWQVPFILLAAVRVQIAHAETLTEVITPEDHECMNALKIDINKLATFFDKQYKVKLDDPVLNEYAICWHTRMGMMDENRNFNWEKVVQLPMIMMPLFRAGATLSQQEASNFVTVCKQTIDLKAENVSAQLNNCIVDQILKHIM